MAFLSKETAAKRVTEARQQALMEFAEDPFLGYKKFDEALGDYKFTSQAEVLARMFNNENVFVSGPAGSGKSTVVNKFIEVIDADTQGKANVAVTASTGIAASLIGGQTIHSWSGLGISSEPFSRKDITPMMWAARPKIIDCDILVIDEVSMLPGYLFTKLDEMLKFFRKNKKPFGGVQLILLGDFLQLPPVSRAEDKDLDTGFAIFTDSWKLSEIRHCYMDKTHRATDRRLKYVLGRISIGEVDDKVKKLIASRKGGFEKCDPNKTYTQLFTTNKNVDEFNRNEFEKNSFPARTFKAREEGPAKHIKKIYKTYNVAEAIDLKVGAKVMLTSNLKFENELLPNGSLGVIETFLGNSPRVRFNNGKVHTIEMKQYPLKEKQSVKLSNGADLSYEEVVAMVHQIPLKLGYAITVHKSQGQTFDGVVADLSKCFTPGLGYVALSRVRSLDDLVILDINDKAFSVNERSQKVNKAVKARAKRWRTQLEEEKGLYEELLMSSMYRTEMVRGEIMDRVDMSSMGTF